MPHAPYSRLRLIQPIGYYPTQHATTQRPPAVPNSQHPTRSSSILRREEILIRDLRNGRTATHFGFFRSHYLAATTQGLSRFRNLWKMCPT
jgi:hypothetical protein